MEESGLIPEVPRVFLKYGNITQSVEWRTVNPCVVGSIPTIPAISGVLTEW